MKATHYGTCQICGSLQKAPNGRLAKHGYTKQWSFFTGTCRGSHELPFEESKDLLEAVIEGVKVSIANYIPSENPINTPFTLTPEEKAIFKKWQNDRRQHQSNKAWVAFQEPRAAKWALAELKPVTA